MIARRSIDAASSANAVTVVPIAARESGVGEAARPTGPDDAAARVVTNEPVTPAAAKAGCETVAGESARSRRPFASSTAWPTCAAKPIAVAMTPSTKRSEETCAICRLPDAMPSAVGSAKAVDQWSGESGAAGRGSGTTGRAGGGGQGEREAAVAAGVVDGLAHEAALRARDDEVLAGGGARGAGLVDRALARAVG